MGQQTEFYMPTYTDDIELGYDLIATTAVMRILGPEFAGDYKDDIVYKDLIIFLEGGSYLIKTVQQIYAVDDPTGNDSIIQTTTPFSADISLDSIRQICWMPQWRMGSDTLSLSYVTDEVCQFQITMKTVPYEETE
jgi:hypothetical protein